MEHCQVSETHDLVLLMLCIFTRWSCVAKPAAWCQIYIVHVTVLSCSHLELECNQFSANHVASLLDMSVALDFALCLDQKYCQEWYLGYLWQHWWWFKVTLVLILQILMHFSPIKRIVSPLQHGGWYKLFIFL